MKRIIKHHIKHKRNKNKNEAQKETKGKRKKKRKEKERNDKNKKKKEKGKKLKYLSQQERAAAHLQFPRALQFLHAPFGGSIGSGRSDPTIPADQGCVWLRTRLDGI
jgi:ribosomal protein S4